MSKRVSFSSEIETRTIEEIDRQSEESRSDEESQRQFNKFQLLNLVDGADTNEDQDDSDNVDEAIHSDDDSSGSELKGKPKQINKQKNSKLSKKSRKKRNKKGKGPKEIKYNETEFDIDLVINRNDNEKKSVNKMYQEYNKHVKLLKIDTRSLLPENELKKIFGKSVVRDDRSRYQGHGGQRSKFVNLRFVDSRQASLFAGPKMELDDFLNEIRSVDQQDQANINQNSKTKRSISNKTLCDNTLFNSDRPVYFKFVHDKEYQAAQRAFVQAVHMAHPEAIVHNLSIYQNHAESLLQLSHIIRLSEDYKQASDMIERALLTFERGFHTRFNLATAQCRLSYRRPENRTFFIVLFEQMTSCHRRGLRKTPLEYCKLLLSLEPENDPLLATQLIDFFAIRSEEYDFLIEFYNNWWQVQKLPNMKFSLAMALFLKSKNKKQSKADTDELLSQSDEQLQNSLLLFPNFILPLLDACAGEPSHDLKKCAYFDYSPYGNKYRTVPESLEVLIELYVKRSFGLWKQKHTMAWLERNLASLVDKFASGELKEGNENRKLTEHWSQFKKPAPKNLLRHIALCDLKVKMPSSASVSTFLAVDPFPPTDAIETYHSGLHQLTRGSHTSTGTSGLAGLFLRSFLPSFSMTDQVNQQQQAHVLPSAGASNRQTRTTELSSSTSNQIDQDQEIALGDFMLNELADNQADSGTTAEYSAFQSSLRDLASSMTSMMNLIPMVREQRENLNSAVREAEARRQRAPGDGSQAHNEEQEQQPSDQADEQSDS